MFNKLFIQIILENKLSQIQLINLNKNNQQQLDLFLKGINLAAKASNNDLWDVKIFNLVSQNYPTRNWYFLKLNNEIIGTLSSRIINDVMFLSCFAIFQQFQGLGLGYLSMQKIIENIKNKYPNLKIQLNVSKINKKAQKLYKKCQFKTIKILPTKFVLELKSPK